MRKSLILATILCCIIFSNVKAQYVTIPDTVFRNFLRENYPTCLNAQGQLDTTCSAILSVEGITVSRYSGLDRFHDLTGLQYFKNITYLDISLNCCLDFVPVIPSLKRIDALGTQIKLSWLPNGLKVVNMNMQDNTSQYSTAPFIDDTGHLPDSLEVFDCGSVFTGGTLPPLPAGLRYLDISANSAAQVGTLPQLPTSLKHLNCRNAVLTQLPALPSSLTYFNWSAEPPADGLPLPSLPRLLDTFEFSQRLMKALPAMPSSLKYFSCWGTDTTSIIPAMPAGLKTFHYTYSPALRSMPPLPNSIEDIELLDVNIPGFASLPTSLKRLVIFYDPSLTSLPPLPPTLTYVDCHANGLTSLPVLHDGLITVLCYSNRIREIQRIPNTIETLDIRGNNIFCLPLIPRTPYHTTIKADGTIKCVSNLNTNLSYYQDNSSVSVIPKLCTRTNNERRCQIYPVIKGYLFYDANNNGIKDPGEPGKKDARVTLTGNNTNFSFSDKNGYYEVQADSLGTYTVTPEPWSVFFDFVPTNASFSFSRYDTVANQDFIIQPNTTTDSVEINITSLQPLRRGFSLTYNISYENTGSSTLVAPVVTLHYDDTKLEFQSGSVPLTPAGNTLVLNTADMPPFAQGSFTATFRVNTTVPLGDSVITTAVIAANSKIATSTARDIVTGSYDPNDKHATPQLSPLQVINGEYIDYTIRFQNTGTDTAFNVVISDTLSSDLQWNTLQMIASSHNCKTTVQGNVVFFEFLDILLPDSNVNEPKSHGFVSFRIKPQPTVQPNTTIPNKAAIYFDYNAPVITNTAGTLIKNFIVVPLKLISFSAVPQNDNTTAVYWNTSNEINTKQFVIEQSNDGAQFTAVINVAAKGNANNSYYSSVQGVGTGIIYYRLKIVDNDGSFMYSPVIKVDRRKNGTGISILTNPVRDALVINISNSNLNNTNASIINMQGAVVKSFIIKEGSQTINLRNLPSGIYYIKYLGGSQKIVMQ